MAVADVVLAVESFYDSDGEGNARSVLFIDLRLANGTNGFVKESQTFFLLHPTDRALALADLLTYRGCDF